MTVVKGTKARHWKVVESKPRVYIWGAVAALVVFVLGLQGAYWFGFKQGMAGQERALRDLAAVRLELDAARAEEVTMRRTFESVRLGAEVDQQALEDVRQQLLELKSEIAEAEEENQFYRNLMAPAGNASGLNIGTVELEETELKRRYRFKIVMQQLSTDHELLKGTLKVNIIGQQNDELRVIPLADLSKDIPSANIKLRFKYFQNVEGEMVLPEGFTPERIELEARATGKKAATVEKRFGWLVRARD